MANPSVPSTPSTGTPVVTNTGNPTVNVSPTVNTPAAPTATGVATNYTTGIYTYLYQINDVNYFASGQVTAAAMNKAASVLGANMTCSDVPESQYTSNLVNTGVEKMAVDLGSFFAPATDTIWSTKFQGGIIAYHLVPDQSN